MSILMLDIEKPKRYNLYLSLKNKGIFVQRQNLTNLLTGHNINFVGNYSSLEKP